MQTPRLWAGVAALGFFVAALTTATIYADRTEARSVHTLAPQMFARKNFGSALQRAAFRQPDLLPVYGSSDLNVRNAYHASALFRTYPTGFTVFPVGGIGSTSVTWLQALAALGADLRGRKVVVSVPARTFVEENVDSHAYAANFSNLHASELAFSMHLSFSVKQAAARRLLEFPDTLTNEPLLTFALERLASGSMSGRVVYYASLPLGVLSTWMLRLQDHWETVAFLHAQRGMTSPQRRSAPLDWAVLRNAAEQETRRKAGESPFGFERTFWAAHAPEIAMQKGLYASASVFLEPRRSAEWLDFDLMLRVIKDLGGQPLILSRPMNGAYFDYLGVPFATRRGYYDRLEEIAKTHAAAVTDFAEHDSDNYFTIDPVSHLSSAGWVHYDQALDDFFHERRSNNL